MSAFELSLFNNDSPNLAQIINATNAGVWEFDLFTKKLTWSAGFYKILGYEPGEIECSYGNFIDHLLYYQDKKSFLNTIQSSVLEVAYIRLLTKHGYQWFQSTTQRQADASITGTLINVHQIKLSEFQAAAKTTSVAETNQLVNLAGWEIDMATNHLHLDKEAFDILELQEETLITIDELISFYEPEHRPTLNRAISTCGQYGRPFDVDLKLRTAKNNVIWIKTKAVAIIDSFGKCIIIRGIIQNIHADKLQEQDLKSSLKLVNHQNKRLQNFAYIVSHNLRAYINNLQFMINLHEETTLVTEQKAIFSRIKTVGDGLNTTIGHLNEIVKVEFETSKQRTLIEFDLLFKNIVNSLQSTIQITNAVIKYDFSKCPSLYYLPAYLESIFHNLLTNALKYRHPDRAPLIYCESKIENGHTYITFEDNGIGIDLEKYGQKIFGMYQTFHDNQDAQGIGLFITRNQVEALGGSISIESTLKVGTKFTIKLN